MFQCTRRTIVICFGLLLVLGTVFVSPAAANELPADEVCDASVSDCDVEICDEITGDCGITVCAPGFDGCDPAVPETDVEEFGTVSPTEDVGDVAGAVAAGPATLPRTGVASIHVVLGALAMVSGGAGLLGLARREA